MGRVQKCARQVIMFGSYRWREKKKKKDISPKFAKH